MAVAQQPLDLHPDLTDVDLRGNWLGRLTRAGGDASPAADDMLAVNEAAGIVWERVGAHFTAASNGYLRRAEANWRSGDSFGTISAWVKFDSIGGSSKSIFVSSDEFGGMAVRALRFDVTATGLLEIYQVNNDIADSVRGGTTLVTDQWYYLVVVSNGSTYALYVNGVAETLSINSGTNSGDWFTETLLRDNILIGAFVANAIALLFIDGTIKDVQYRSRAVPANEILYEYQQGVPDDDLRLWTIGGDKDLTRFDRVLSVFNDTIVGHEMYFDGVTDYIQTPAIDFTDHTVSLWFKADALEDAILFNNVPADGNRIAIATRADGTIRAGHWSGASYRSKSGGTYAVDKWSHVVMTYDDAPTRTARAWLDGVELAGTDDPSSGNGISLRLAMSTSGTSPFAGSIRDVRVFNEAKSEAWAVDLYNRTKRAY